MRTTTLNQIFGMLAITAIMFGAETAIAQNAAAPPSMKTIGTPSAIIPTRLAIEISERRAPLLPISNGYRLRFS
ncbi:hypothetical protein V1283_006395 [Bradyrhizobium sp. AZCC 2262]|uniref:hypothetical protein n=1 Tax=Bradyrhizobium sp. AZCC 2262 TaxID=3117022 RepID=UPI002FF32D36